MYTQKVMEAFQNPKNVGEIENYDGMGMIGSEACGDIMQVFIKVENGVITDAKFKTFGLRRSHCHLFHRHRDDQGHGGG